MAKRVQISKDNVVLDKIEIVYLPIDAIKPNSYNPNRQAPHNFELLCKSIAADGFTRPVTVRKETMEIIDGEHRWRAAQALGFDEVPCVLMSMSDTQMRVSTLRMNRAHGSEDADLAADVLRTIAEMGGLEGAQSELMLDDVEVSRIMADLGDSEVSQMTMDVPDSMLGPTGHGQSEIDKSKNIDFTADQTRAKERLLAKAKEQEERDMKTKDEKVYRLVLFFTGDESKIIKEILEPNPAQNLLALCMEAAAGGQEAHTAE